jgi:hypothetical protein
LQNGAESPGVPAVSTNPPAQLQVASAEDAVLQKSCGSPRAARNPIDGGGTLLDPEQGHRLDRAYLRRWAGVLRRDLLEKAWEEAGVLPVD